MAPLHTRVAADPAAARHPHVLRTLVCALVLAIAIAMVVLICPASATAATNTAINQFTNDTNAVSGATQPTTITTGFPHFSWLNDFGATVSKQRVQVVSDPLTNVVGLWHLDGDLVDSSGNGFNLTQAGGAGALGFAAGQSGFSQTSVGDGVDNRATVTNAAFDLGSSTVEAWVKVAGLARNASNHDFIVSKGPSGNNRNFAMGIQANNVAGPTDGSVACDMSTGGATTPGVLSAAKINDGAWHHIACVWDNVAFKMTVYVDGAASGNATFAGPVDSGSGSPVAIGAKFDGTDPFNGSVDEVRISNVARGAAEILGYYRTQVPHYEAMWDSDPADNGSASLAASCAAAARCSDVRYGSSGGTADPLQAGARYYARAKFEPTAGPWNAWGAYDWFQLSTSPLSSPSGLFTNNSSAVAGSTNPNTITNATPHFSFQNPSSTAMTAQRVQVLNDPIDSDTVALWHFDSATGTTTDSTGNRHDLAFVGGPTAPAGKAGFGEALGVDGATQHAVAAASPEFNLSNDFTVETWFKTSSLSAAFPTLIQETTGGCVAQCNFDIDFNTGMSKLQAKVTSSGTAYTVPSISTTLADGVWHLATLTMSSGNVLSLYVDGAPQGSVAVPGPADYAGGGVYVGVAKTLAPNGRFNGQLDEARIVARALSAAEIQSYYASAMPHGTVLWDSDPADSGVAIASCATAGRCADSVYDSSGSAATPLAFAGNTYWVRGKLETAAGAWSPWSTPDWFTTTVNTAPGAPTALAQYKANGTTAIASGAWTSDGASTNVVLKFNASDPDASQTLTPWVEVLPNATAFTGTCGQAGAGMFAGTPVSAPTGGTSYGMVVSVTGLTTDTLYHWRACVVDQSGQPGAWVNKGASPDFKVDATATAPTPVADGTGADTDATGSTTQLSGNWTTAGDGTGSGVASYDWCINETADCVTTIVSSGNVTSPTVTFTKSGLALTAGTKYYVCVRTVDAMGNQSGYTCSDGQTVLVAPGTLFTDGVDASAGTANATGVQAASPHFSLGNSTGLAVNKQRTQVYSDVVDSSVVALWHMDTGTGVTSDATGNGHALTLASAPTSPAGATNFSQALGTNGTTQYASATASAGFNLANDFTVSAWFNTASIANDPYPVLVQKAASGCLVASCNFSIEFDRGANLLVTKVSAGGAVSNATMSAAPLVDGAWHHVATTVDGTNKLRLYVDGVLRGGPVSLAGTAVASNIPVMIGAAAAGANPFGGKIDDVQIQSRALSTAEVAGYYNTAQPHGTVLWDSDATDAGVAMASCNNGVRCADIVYGGANIARQGARYWVTAKYRSSVGAVWSPWSAPDWYETATLGAPGTLFANTANASAGNANATGVQGAGPHFSLLNGTGVTVDKQRTQVLSDVVDPSVVGLWHMDTGTGVTTDSSGNGRALTLVGSPATVAAQASFGDALRFDGTARHAVAPPSAALDLTSPFSVDAWFRTPGSASDMFIVGKQSSAGPWAINYSVYITSSGLLRFASSYGVGANPVYAGTSSAPFIDNQWHHVAGVYTGATLELYVDGQLRVSAPFAGTPDVAGQVTIGRDFATGGNRFTGDIDDVRISNVPRSAAEVAGYYNTAQPHGALLWDSDATDAGVALASCTTGLRCADIVYGGANIARQGARYWVTAKYRSSVGAVWSPWSAPDWYETATLGAPGTLFANTANASAGNANATGVQGAGPHFSLLNGTGVTVDKQRTQVLSDVVDPSVVGLWHMDTGTGVTTDSSGNGYSLTMNGAPTTPAGPYTSFNQAVGLNGTTQYASRAATPALDLPNNFTVQAWFQGPASPPASSMYITEKGLGGNSNWTLVIGTSGKPSATVSVAGVSKGIGGGTAVVTDGGWHHIVLTVTSGNIGQLYVDGAPYGPSAVLGGTVGGSGQPMAIGRFGNGAGGWFAGAIDDVEVHNRAVSAAEIAGYYNTAQPHGAVLWDSDATDAGVALASCATGVRCADIAYGGANIARQGARYWVTAKYRSSVGAVWSPWSAPDWYETATLGAPGGLFADGANASGGSTHATGVMTANPHFSLVNSSGVTVDKQRTQVVSDVVDSSMAALWHMDTGTGVTTDATGNGHALTLSGGPGSPAGAANFGQALGLDGASQSASAGASAGFNMSNDFTASVWFSSTTIANAQYPIMLQKGTGGCTPGTCNFSLEFERSTNMLDALVGSGGSQKGVSTSAAPLLDGSWHNATMTVDASNNLRLYVDGVQKGAALALGAGVAATSIPVQIGTESTGINKFQGKIDDIAIWSRALPAAEIAGYYNTAQPHGAVLWDSDATDAGVALASCTTGVRCADITYAGPNITRQGARYWVTSKYRSSVGAVWSPWSAPDWYETAVNQVPSSPSALAQFRANGSTSIGAGAWTTDGAGTNVVLKFAASDPDGSQTLTPWVEVVPSATGFSGTCASAGSGMFSGSPVAAPTGGTGYGMAVSVSGLSPNTQYHWRACVVDQGALASGWAAMGGSPDLGVDTSATAPATPNDGTGADVDSSVSTVQMSANWTSPGDGTGSGVSSYDWCFNETADCVTTIVSSGSVTSPTVAFTKSGLALSAGTRYYVCVRTVDAVGNQSGYTCSNGQTVMPAPNALFTDNVNAAAGSAHPTNVTALNPHFSLVNSSGLTVDKQRTQVSSDVVDSNVVALWHMDTATGVTTDTSGNGHVLTFNGSPTSPAGQAAFGQALGLDGSTQHARSTVAADLGLANDFTVSAWFNTATIAGATRSIIVQQSGGAGGCVVASCNYSIEFDRDAAILKAQVSDGAAQTVVATPSGPLVDGTWHHAVLTVDGANTLALYVDGVQQGSPVAMGGPAVTPPGPVLIGAGGTGAYDFLGSIDDVEILRRTLSPAEVAGYYATAQPHGALLWDSDATDAGVALPSCNTAVRCADIAYGGPGITRQGARYYVSAKYRSTGGVWSPWSTPDWFETLPPTMTVGVDSASPGLSTAMAPTVDATATSTLTITTNAANGYTLTAADQSDTWAMQDAGTNQIADYTGPCGGTGPTTWAANVIGGFGLTVLDVTGGATNRLAKWGTGTGTSATDFVNNRYCGLKLGTSATIHQRTGYYTAPDTVTVGYRADIAAGQPAGTYSSQVTYTATMAL